MMPTRMDPEPHVLILRAGHTDRSIIRRHGDYDRWFTDRMHGLGCRFSLHHVPDQGLPETAPWDGVLITGAAESVLDADDWMRDTAEFVARFCDHIPILAVCFGAQLTAQALGGRVEKNPNGWEIGTVTVELTEAGLQDPLFQGLHRIVEVQSTHEDHIARLPPGAELLAGNQKSTVQAFAVGERLRAVQFHPEASASIIRRLVQLRKPTLQQEARRRTEDSAAARTAVSRLEEDIHDTGSGRRVLENWVRNFVNRSGD